VSFNTFDHSSYTHPARCHPTQTPQAASLIGKSPHTCCLSFHLVRSLTKLHAVRSLSKIRQDDHLPVYATTEVVAQRRPLTPGSLCGVFGTLRYSIVVRRLPSPSPHPPSKPPPSPLPPHGAVSIASFGIHTCFTHNLRL